MSYIIRITVATMKHIIRLTVILSLLFNFACLDLLDPVEKPTSITKEKVAPEKTVDCKEIEKRFQNSDSYELTRKKIDDFAASLSAKEVKHLLPCMVRKPYSPPWQDTFNLIKQRKDLNQNNISRKLLNEAIKEDNISAIIYHAYLGDRLELAIYGDSKNLRFDVVAANAIFNKYKNKDIKNNHEEKKNFIHDMAKVFSNIGNYITKVPEQNHFPSHADRPLFSTKIDANIKKKVADLLGENSPDYIKALGLTDGFDICHKIVTIFENPEKYSFNNYKAELKILFNKFLSLWPFARLSLFYILHHDGQFWPFGYDELERLLFLPIEEESADILRLSLEALKLEDNKNMPYIMDLGNSKKLIGMGMNITVTKADLPSVNEWVNKKVFATDLSPLQLAVGRVGRKALADASNDDLPALKKVVDTLLFYGADPFVKDSSGKTMFEKPLGPQWNILDIVVKNLGSDGDKIDKLYTQVKSVSFKGGMNTGFAAGGKSNWLKGALEGYSLPALLKAESKFKKTTKKYINKPESKANLLDGYSKLLSDIKNNKNSEDNLINNFVSFFEKYLKINTKNIFSLKDFINITKSDYDKNPDIKESFLKALTAVAKVIKDPHANDLGNLLQSTFHINEAKAKAVLGI
jgi:hypothetical protein